MLLLITNLILIYVFVSTDVFWSTCRNEFKREGAGRGNWGTQSDDITQ